MAEGNLQVRRDLCWKVPLWFEVTSVLLPKLQRLPSAISIFFCYQIRTAFNGLHCVGKAQVKASLEKDTLLPRLSKGHLHASACLGYSFDRSDHISQWPTVLSVHMSRSFLSHRQEYYLRWCISESADGGGLLLSDAITSLGAASISYITALQLPCEPIKL